MKTLKKLRPYLILAVVFYILGALTVFYNVDKKVSYVMAEETPEHLTFEQWMEQEKEWIKDQDFFSEYIDRELNAVVETRVSTHLETVIYDDLQALNE